jgi:hypothetical protein
MPPNVIAGARGMGLGCIKVRIPPGCRVGHRRDGNPQYDRGRLARQRQHAGRLSNVRDIEGGKVRARRELFGAD